MWQLQHPWIFSIIIPLIVLELVLKGFALWKSARNNQLYWFLAVLVLNTIGILPAVYLLFFQVKRKAK